MVIPSGAAVVLVVDVDQIFVNRCVNVTYVCLCLSQSYHEHQIEDNDLFAEKLSSDQRSRCAAVFNNDGLHRWIPINLV